MRCHTLGDTSPPDCIVNRSPLCTRRAREKLAVLAGKDPQRLVASLKRLLGAPAAQQGGGLAAKWNCRGTCLGLGLPAKASPDGQSRRWHRNDRTVTVEDWSQRPNIQQWLSLGVTGQPPTWHAPLWTHTIETTVVLHDAPLYRNGRFLGMLGQIVPIAELSAELVDLATGTPFVPFVLYGHRHVLAHPKLVGWNPKAS